MRGLAATFILCLLIAGHQPPVTLKALAPVKDTVVVVVPQAVVIPIYDTIITIIKKEEPVINTGKLHPQQVVQYAKTLIGTRYLYGSTDPKKGFDCSGFITYVFNHFKVKVPRSSVDFTHVGTEVNYVASKPGDLILFTGTDSTIRVVGHLGIVVSNENNKLYFIHSTSGKQNGVTVTELSPYYLTRFVRVARVFPNTTEPIALSKKQVKSKSSKPKATKSVTSRKKSSTVKKTSAKKPVSSTNKSVQKTTSKTKPVSSTKKTGQKTSSKTKPVPSTKKPIQKPAKKPEPATTSTTVSSTEK